MSVVMADLCWTGGLTEGRKIAAMADTYHQARSRRMTAWARSVSSPASTPAFSQPNTLIQESVRAFYTGWYRELVTVMPIDRERLRVADGRTGAWARTCCRRYSKGPT